MYVNLLRINPANEFYQVRGRPSAVLKVALERGDFLQFKRRYDTIGCVSKRMGNKILGTFPLIAAAVSDSDLRLLRPADVKDIGLLELRVDMFKNLSEDYVIKVFNQAKQRFKKPLLCTIRVPSEGGKRHIDERRRRSLFEAITPLADILDIEIRSSLFPGIVRLGHAYKRPVIASYHNLEKTPADSFFLAMLNKARRASADMTKLAVKAATMNDVAHLLRFTMDHGKENLITISLGTQGRISRVVNPLFGSLITYGYIGQPKADGQMHVRELADQLSLYRS